MADFAGALGANKAASTLLVLFIPSKDRNEPVVIQCYTSEQALEQQAPPCETSCTAWDARRGRERSGW